MKTPTQSPTHADLEPSRLAAMGLELAELADSDDVVELAALVELAEDRGRPPSHYVAALALATDHRLATRPGAPTLRVCVGSCQRYGALDLIDRVIASGAAVTLAPATCLDRCDRAPACELHAAAGTLVLAPATASTLAEAIAALAT